MPIEVIYFIMIHVHILHDWGGGGGGGVGGWPEVFSLHIMTLHFFK